jgi:hypothetical protein
MQQDNIVSACASACLWVVSWHMSHVFRPDFRLYHTSEITDLATQFFMSAGRAMPSQGPSTEQITYALRGMGLEPIADEPRSDQEARHHCYSYIESGIPVILSLVFPGEGGHAVAAIGHTLQRDDVSTVAQKQLESTDPQGNTVSLKFARTSDFVAEFVVQDDAGGPFRLIEFVGWDAFLAEPRYAEPKRLLEQRIRKSIEADPRYMNHQATGVSEQADMCLVEFREQYPCPVIVDRAKGDSEKNRLVGFLKIITVGLPASITVDHANAEERAASFLNSWYAGKGVSPSPLVLRTFLQRSNDLKKHWSQASHMAPELARGLRTHGMSRWVWVTEIAEPTQFRNKTKMALGQIIQDSTSHSTTADAFDLIAFHMPGEYTLMNPDGSAEEASIDEDTYPILHRE